MSNKRISELEQLFNPADEDMFVVVDNDEADITIKTKRISFGDLRSKVEQEISTSPAFTGTPTAPTQAPTDNSTKIATTEYVKSQISAIPATPDATTTSKGVVQLAGDLGGTASSPTVPALAQKAPIDSPAFTGTPTAPTPATSDNSTKLATTAFILDYINSIKGMASGICPLGPDSLISSTYLPSYVDDVLEFSALNAFPVTGQTSKIYVALDTNKTYRWSGSAYVYITSGAVDSVNGKTGVVSLTTTDISEGTNLYWTPARFDTAFATKTTSNLPEGSNLYYTQARFDTAFSGKTTTNLLEGTNLYYTQARFDTAFSGKSTTNLTEGTNLYWTQTRFDTAFSGKSTTNLSEGVNLYWTGARFDSAFALKSTTNLTEGTNLYWTQTRFDNALAVKFDMGTANNDFLVWNTATAKWERRTQAQVKALIAPTPATVAVPALNIDWSAGNFFTKDVSANTTFTFSNASDGMAISVVVANTSASEITITFPTANLFKVSGALTIPANSIAVYSFMYAGSRILLADIKPLVSA